MKLSDKGKILKIHLEKYNQQDESILIDEYVIMPNHIHFIIRISKRVAEGGDPYIVKNNKFI